MNAIKAIRLRLGVTQSGLAELLGCTQGNVGHYENPDKPQTVPPATAMRLVEVARKRGIELTMDQVYGLDPLPPASNEDQRRARA